MLKLNPDFMIKMTVDQKIIGVVLGAFDGRTASVHRLAVLSEFQKNGYGGILMKALEDKLKTAGVKKLALQVHISNEKIIEYYLKRGYQEMTYARTFYKDL